MKIFGQNVNVSSNCKNLDEKMENFSSQNRDGISSLDGKLIYIQGKPDNCEDLVFSGLIDFITGTEENKICKEAKDFLNKVNLNNPYEIMLEYFKEINFNPKFNNPHLFFNGYFDPVGFAGYYWFLEDIIEVIQKDDIKLCWGETFEGLSNFVANEENKKLVEKLVKLYSYN